MTAGETNDLTAFLPLQLVDYTWTATPTEVEDHYEFTLDATFQTKVPFPVVTMQPGAIDLCTLQGQSNQIQLSITNSGLISAQGLSLIIGTNANWFVEALATNLGDLLPETNLVVPVSIIQTGSSTSVSSGIPAWLNYHVAAVNGTFVFNVPLYIYDANPLNCVSGQPQPPQPPGPPPGGGGGGSNGNGNGGGATNEPVYPPPITVQSPLGAVVQVKIQIDQSAVIARDGFHATLELDNESGNVVSNLDVNITIYDASNNVANDFFGISSPTLSGLNAVDGTGQMTNGQSGQALWTIVPTTNAAPQAQTQYSIGGSFSYIFNGEPVTVPLFPAPITVLPTPIFTVDYFLQHDVYGDDPFTPQIEPSLPFALGIQVKNTGYGNANDFSITSSQPKIIANANDLIIAFQLIGSQIGQRIPVAFIHSGLRQSWSAKRCGRAVGPHVLAGRRVRGIRRILPACG